MHSVELTKRTAELVMLVIYNHFQLVQLSMVILFCVKMILE